MPVNMPLVVPVKARAVEAQATRHVLIRLGDGSMKHRKVQRPTVVAGDFNDNVLWDNPKKLNNHGTRTFRAHERVTGAMPDPLT